MRPKLPPFQFIVILAIVFVLGGCLPGALKISVNSSPDGVVEFLVDHVSGDCGAHESALIQTIWVGKIQDDGKAKTIWHLRSIDAEGLPIRSLKYGVNPEGFQEQEKSQSLINGAEYDIEVSGHGCSGGLKFKIGGY